MMERYEPARFGMLRHPDGGWVAYDDHAAEIGLLRARVEELEERCASRLEDVNRAMATARHREDLRAAAVERYEAAERRVEELERFVAALRDTTPYMLTLNIRDALAALDAALEGV